jgi:hypothetical protein
MKNFELKCSHCGWVHAAIPLSSEPPEHLGSYLGCVHRGAPSRDFVPTGRDDAPADGAPLPPVLTPESLLLDLLSGVP